MSRYFLVFVIFCISFLNANADKTKTITAVFPSNFPPQFHVNKHGQPYGFAIDIIEEVAKISGYKIKYIPASSWPEAIKIFNDGKADIVPNARLENSNNNFINSVPMETFTVGFFKRKASANIDSLKDLENKVIVVRETNVGERLAKNIAAKKIITKKTVEEAILSLLSGESDALIYPIPVLHKILIKSGLENNIIAFEKPLLEIKRCIRIQKSRKKLANDLNQALIKLIASDKYHNIYNKWYSSAAPDINKTKIITILSFSAFISILTGLIIIILLKANKKVKIYSSKLEQEIDERNSTELKLKEYQNNLEQKVKERTAELKKSRIAAISIMEDIDIQRKLVEKQNAELKSLNEQLNEETKQRMMHEKMVFEQKKLADMGQMINAIAHQWRQPLNALGLYSQDIIDAYNYDELDKSYINEFADNSMKLIKHLSNTIDDFRNFFKPNNKLETFEIIYEIIKIYKLISIQFSAKNITVLISCKCSEKSLSCKSIDDEVNCTNHKTKVEGYLGEFKQAVINILYNASDSIVEKIEMGKIIQGKIFITITTADDKVSVSIKDNGLGIPEDHILEIFNPYFTTKEEGKGTGIGLYMTKMVIEKHMKGNISAKNHEEGAEFIIKIPIENKYQPDTK